MTSWVKKYNDIILTQESSSICDIWRCFIPSRLAVSLSSQCGLGVDKFVSALECFGQPDQEIKVMPYYTSVIKTTLDYGVHTDAFTQKVK